jgi:hypothetical protein
MYFYYDIDDKEWFVRNHKEKWYGRDSDDELYDLDLLDPRDDTPIPFEVAERWVWGRMNIPDFKVHVYVNRVNTVKAWVFVIEDKENAMHFKLRWPTE